MWRRFPGNLSPELCSECIFVSIYHNLSLPLLTQSGAFKIMKILFRNCSVKNFNIQMIWMHCHCWTGVMCLLVGWQAQLLAWLQGRPGQHCQPLRCESPLLIQYRGSTASQELLKVRVDQDEIRVNFPWGVEFAPWRKNHAMHCDFLFFIFQVPRTDNSWFVSTLCTVCTIPTQ